MSREKPSYYDKASPIKTSQHLSYPRKLDTLESTKPNRSQPSFLNESKENIPSSLSGGMRDVLLMKCKQAIEELHLELEGEKKMRQQVEQALAEAETEAHDKDSQLRDIRYKNEKQQDEIRNLRAQNDTLRKDLEVVEDRLRGLGAKEVVHNELQKDFQSVCKANNELKERIEDLNADLENRDIVIKQWNDTLGSIQDKIITLEKENSELKEEYQVVIEENGKLQRLVKESENSTAFLKDKYDAAERLNQQLQRENKTIENLREQNMDLREKVQEYERTLTTFKEEVQLNNLRLEERFLKEKEETEDNYKERSRRKINELQETYDLEIMKLKESNENIKSDYFKVKSERDVLKQELARVQDRLELLELESKKMTGTFANNYENLEKKKAEEIERLKGVNEDQKRLLASYEKIIDTEKSDHSLKLAALSENNTKLREEVLDLKTKNEYLSNKLKDCQEELAYLRTDVNRTFQEEEEKQGHLMRKLNNLETELVERNTAINTLNSQLDHLRISERRQGDEIEALIRQNKELIEELELNKRQMGDLIGENDDLRGKQKEFYEILQGKINKISEELKQERERRIQAQNTCKSHEEHIVELEAKLKSYKNLAASHAEKNPPRRPAEQLNQADWGYKKSYPATEGTYRVEQSTRAHQDIRPRDKEYAPYRGETRDSVPRSRVRENSFDRSREIEETPQRLTDIRDVNKVQEAGSPDAVQHTFINRFKSVIEKLENKLESITADIDNSNT